MVSENGRRPAALAALLALGLAALTGYARSAPAPVAPGCEFSAEAPVRYLALGDSYTIGESVPAAERWPVQLGARLRARGLPLDEPLIVARTGWTTDELGAALDAAEPHGPFEFVSLLIGVNNQYRGRDPEEYRAQFAALLMRAAAYAGGRPGRVLVLSIPDWGVTPFALGQDRERIGREIDRFNLINRAESERAGAVYLDITPFSRRALGEAELVAGDGLHPSGRMYAEWARLAEPLVCGMLE